MSTTITDYNAAAIPAEHWSEFEDFVRAAVSDFGPKTPTQARRLLTILARHVHWCWQGGAYPLDRNVILRREVIAESVEKGMAHFAKRTRAAYRSHLFALSDALLAVPHRPAFVPPIGATSAQSPYTPREIALLRAWASGQSTNYRRVNATLLLALGLGAGLSSREMCGLRAGDVTVDDDGVLLDVTVGTRPRVVPVMAAWEEPLAAFARATLRSDQWLLMPNRQQEYKRSAVSDFMATTNDRPFPINTHRLRSTWIVHHLAIGTPVLLLARAAGTASPQALGRYLEHVPDVDPALARRHLRAAARDADVMWKRS